MNDTLPAGKGINIGLWLAQIALAGAFGLFGTMKATAPLDEIYKMMLWAPSMPEWFIRTLGGLEVLGAIGLILPSLTRIQPRLTVLAALCFVVLQVLAIGLHVSRGEFPVLVLNFVLLPLAAFVFWGRSKKAIIAPR